MARLRVAAVLRRLANRLARETEGPEATESEAQRPVPEAWRRETKGDKCESAY